MKKWAWLLVCIMAFPQSVFAFGFGGGGGGGSVPIATDSVVGKVKGGGNVSIAADGTMSVTNVQAYDADLTTYAGITPSADIQALLGMANYSALLDALFPAVASPTALFNDSDAPGTDKEIAKIVGAYIDGADGAENGTLSLYVHQAGTTTEYIQVDGKNTDVEIKKVLVPEGGIKVLTPVIDDPDNFAANFTGANLYGGTFIANAAGTAALPDPAVGMNFTYVLEGANANIIDPLGTGTADTIVMNGLAAAADENITSSTSGALCVFQYRAANSWMATCNGFAEATPP